MGLASPEGGGKAPGSPDIAGILDMIGGSGGGGGPSMGTYNNSTSNQPLPAWADGSGNGQGGGNGTMPWRSGAATAPPPGQDLASLLQGPQGNPSLGRGGGMLGGMPPGMPPQAASTPGTGFMSMLSALIGNRGMQS